MDDRPRKRARMHSRSAADKDVVELWWDVMRSDEMLANGLPSLTRSVSGDVTAPGPASAINDPPRNSPRRKKKKKKEATPTNTLLYHMNNNIRTLRRVRTTHAKFTALNQSLEESGGVAPPPIHDIHEDLDDVLDERPWKPPGMGIDMGEENANDCLHWMGNKVLEHAGFQGASKMALDVLASVTTEYLHNVGRTIRFLCDKYGNQMTPEVSISTVKSAVHKGSERYCIRKSFCTPFSRAVSPRQATSSGISRTTSCVMVADLRTLRRSSAIHTERRSVLSCPSLTDIRT